MNAVADEMLEDLAIDLTYPPALAAIADIAALWRYERYHAVCVRPPHLQDFPEFSLRLRGAFGRALHALPSRITSRGRVMPSAFAALFEPLAVGPKGDEIPRPLAIRGWIAGDQVHCEVRVFGWGIVWHQEAGIALMHALAEGIALRQEGRQRVALDITSFHHERVDGIDVQQNGNNASLTMRSPFAARQGATLNEQPDAVVKACIRRVAAMARWQGFGVADAAAAQAAAQHFSVTTDNWRPYGWTRHSRRQRDITIPVSGMLGTVNLSGDPAPMLPWLALAQTCNIGSHASMGLGWFDLMVH